MSREQDLYTFKEELRFIVRELILDEDLIKGIFEDILDYLENEITVKEITEKEKEILEEIYYLILKNGANLFMVFPKMYVDLIYPIVLKIEDILEIDLTIY